jgi:polyvinyl alcohol dehydrogenase (cytochrome)
MYLASSTGFVYALNADTGEAVWKSARLPGAAAGSLVGGVITGSPAVANGKVYVAVARRYPTPSTEGPNGPFVAILDQATGDVLQLAPVLDPAKQKPEYANNVVSSPVVWNGMILQGIMAHEEQLGARGGYSILDAATGSLIHQDWTIPDHEYEAGYRGASIWCTPALDVATGFAYACGGNPASKQLESVYSNALLKIDMRCGASVKTLAGCRAENATFGTIVDVYKGNEDHYYPGLHRQPACDQVPTTAVWSPTCVQLDLDFGASPSLFSITVGTKTETLVGDLQKSGVYHAAYADTMAPAWTQIVGTPGVPLNSSSPAVDGSMIYTAAQVPGQLFGLSKDQGRYRWVSPLPDATHYQSVSVANGVVYTMDGSGNLVGWDAATGVLALVRPVSLDAGAPASDRSSQGVAIARNTIYAVSGSFVVAYR